MVVIVGSWQRLATGRRREVARSGVLIKLVGVRVRIVVMGLGRRWIRRSGGENVTVGGDFGLGLLWRRRRWVTAPTTVPAAGISAAAAAAANVPHNY